MLKPFCSFLKKTWNSLWVCGTTNWDKLGLKCNLRENRINDWFYYCQFRHGMIDVCQLLLFCQERNGIVQLLKWLWRTIPNAYADSFSQIFPFANNLGFQMLILQPAVECILADHTTAHSTSCMSHIPIYIYIYIPMFGYQGCKSYMSSVVHLSENRVRIHMFMKQIGSIGPKSGIVEKTQALHIPIVQFH